jgi:hypothetical protein
MAHDTSHGATAPSHASSDGPLEHPVLPPVHDEAPDTPAWIPLTGLVLLALFAIAAIYRAARGGETEAEPAAEAAAAEAPAEAAVGPD